MSNHVTQVGLGLRRALMSSLDSVSNDQIDFLEVAPENWINVGGRLGKHFRSFSERFPIYLHGLSLNIGGDAPVDVELVKNIKEFMREHNCVLYSEHLTACGDSGHLYDLMPIVFDQASVTRVAARIRQVQDILGQRVLMENASYYAAPAQEMTELDFITSVLEEADCDLLLDVNNIYVNSINHGYDAEEFLAKLPLHRAKYIHIAGHYEEAEDLRIDTHGADVIDPVWRLLQSAYSKVGVLPTLLERDFNFPPISELLSELDTIKERQRASLLVADSNLSHSIATADGSVMSQ